MSMEVCLFGSVLLSQGHDTVFPAFTALQGSGIEIPRFHGKTEIPGGKVLFDAVRELPFHDPRRPFPVFPPGLRSADRLAHLITTLAPL